MERAICTKVFRTKYLKENITTIYMLFSQKFSFKGHLHEHYCTFEQLIGKTLIEIESAVAKQTKNVRFCFFQNILPATIFRHRQRDI